MKPTKGLTKILFLSFLAIILVTGSAVAQGANKLVLDGSTTVGPIAKAFAEYYSSKNPGVNVTVNESGSGNGAKSLINGTCDIANMSRFMKETEFSAAAAKGVMPVAHVVAMDGLPILVHPGNPVTGLTIDQVRDIYAGKITNWKEVGGPDRKIVVVTRDTNSGTYETFLELVMTGKDGAKVKIAGGAEYVGSNGAIRMRIQSTPAAIGYAGLGFVDKTVKALEINGVFPTPDSVTSGEYPVSRPLFMFTNGYPTLGSNAHAFVTLYLSEKGQEIIENIGFVPMTRY